MEIIDREVLETVAELEKCLVTFRGIRQLWAAMSANGAFTAFHEFYPKNHEESKKISTDLYREQVHQLSRCISYAKRIESQMQTNKNRNEA